jgi:hypothetical protein
MRIRSGARLLTANANCWRISLNPTRGYFDVSSAKPDTFGCAWGPGRDAFVIYMRRFFSFKGFAHFAP